MIKSKLIGCGSTFNRDCKEKDFRKGDTDIKETACTLWRHQESV